jgi:hypothetical protein
VVGLKPKCFPYCGLVLRVKPVICELRVQRMVTLVAPKIEVIKPNGRIMIGMVHYLSAALVMFVSDSIDESSPMSARLSQASTLQLCK